MRRFSVLALAVVSTATFSGSSTAASAAVSASAKPVAGTSCSAFPANNWWHADVRGLPVHARSRQWLSHMSTGVDLHPDFGPSYGDGPNYGIPITVVDHSHRRVSVAFDYASESDRVRYPLGGDTRIEGGRNSPGDKHAVVIDRGVCKLFETWNTRVRDGRWRAGSGAVWSLGSNRLRPDGWTSADAAGLPILPGLLRWTEVRDRQVDHAIRFTTDVTSRHHLWPARHDAGSRDSLAYPPMGARFRLKAGFSTDGFSAGAQEVIRAMKTASSSPTTAPRGSSRANRTATGRTGSSPTSSGSPPRPSSPWTPRTCGSPATAPPRAEPDSVSPGWLR